MIELEIGKLEAPHFYVDQDDMSTLKSYCIVAQADDCEPEGYRINGIYFIHNILFDKGDCVYKVTELTEPTDWPVLFSETYNELRQEATKVSS